MKTKGKGRKINSLKQIKVKETRERELKSDSERERNKHKEIETQRQQVRISNTLKGVHQSSLEGTLPLLS